MCFKRGPQGKGTSLLSFLKVGRKEMRRRATGPEPVSTKVLRKHQGENKMSSYARLLSREVEEQERENAMGKDWERDGDS